MKKNFQFDFYKKPLANLIFEQEEAEETEEPAAEEEAETPDEEEPADDDAPAETEEGGESDEETEETSADDSLTSIDDDIESVLIDFETSARKEAELSVNESSLSFLYEQTDEIDIGSFAADVARLVKNYDNLLDIEHMLVKKSRDFLEKRYDEDTAKNFEDTLETQHDITLDDKASSIGSDLEVPLAIGATSATE